MRAARRLPALFLLLPLLLFSIRCIAAVPAAPKDLKAVPKGPQRVDLSWTDRSTNETGFRVERRRRDESFSVLSTVGPDVGSYSDTSFSAGPDDGALYTYRVRALAEDGASAPSADARAVTVYSGEPLYGWLDVTDYGADPTDAVDDTAAIQAALDALGGGFGTDSPHVVYFPQGTYRISATLLLEGKQAVQLAGDRAGETVIRWSPPAPICRRVDGTAFPKLPLIEPNRHRANPRALLYDDTLAMIHADGSDRSTFRNITWDANCRSCGGPDACRIVAFDQSYCGRAAAREYQTGCEAIAGVRGAKLHRDVGRSDTGTSHIDETYRDAYVGLRIGHYGVQDSEVTVRRAHFENNHAGLSIEDANALQIAVWDSSFEHNRYGITNSILLDDLTSSAACAELPRFFMEGGNVQLFRSNFLESLRSDVFIGRENNFTFFDLRSLGSFRFLSAPCQRAATSPISIARSQIRLGAPGTRLPDRRGNAIWLRNHGPLFLFDDTIDNSVFPGKPAVFTDSFANTDVLSIGNLYTTDSPFNTRGKNRVVRISDCDPSLASYPCGRPGPPGVALHDLPEPVDFMAGRDVYTAVDPASFRDVVHAALGAGGSAGAVVHVPSGTIEIAETLVLPDESKLLLLGDSEGSRLSWTGAPGGTLLEIDGDAVSRVVVRDLMLDKGDANPTGIRVTGLGRGSLGAREVLVSKTVATVEGTRGFVLDGADPARIDFVESGAGGVPRRPDVPGVILRAGAGPQHLKTFWVQSGGINDPTYDLEGESADLDVVITGDRAERIGRHLKVSGRAGRIVLHSGLFATRGTSPDAVRVDHFDGNLSVVNVAAIDADQNSGAVISEIDSASASIQSLANSFDNRSSRAPLQTDHVIEPARPRKDGAVDAHPAVPRQSRIDRRAVQVFCTADRGKDRDLGDCQAAEPPGQGFRSVADLDGTASGADARIREGLEPLRAARLPLFFDGTGSTAQLHLDHVTIGRPETALRLEGAVAALLRERFETTPVGGDPSGWLDTGEKSSLASADLFEVAEVDGTHALVTGASGTDVHSHFKRPVGELGAWTAYEFGGRMRIGSTRSGIGVTAHSQYDDPSEPRDAYYSMRRDGDDPYFHLASHPGEARGACGASSTRVNPEADTWYRFCLQVVPGPRSTRVRAKVWAQEENEPVPFGIDCEDARATRLAQGTVGVWSTAGGTKTWDDLEVRPIDPASPPDACLTAAP